MFTKNWSPETVFNELIANLVDKTQASPQQVELFIREIVDKFANIFPLCCHEFAELESTLNGTDAGRLMALLLQTKKVRSYGDRRGAKKLEKIKLAHYYTIAEALVNVIIGVLKVN